MAHLRHHLAVLQFTEHRVGVLALDVHPRRGRKRFEPAQRGFEGFFLLTHRVGGGAPVLDTLIGGANPQIEPLLLGDAGDLARLLRREIRQEPIDWIPLLTQIPLGHFVDIEHDIPRRQLLKRLFNPYWNDKTHRTPPQKLSWID